jgi:hypothetical protein
MAFTKLHHYNRIYMLELEAKEKAAREAGRPFVKNQIMGTGSRTAKMSRLQAAISAAWKLLSDDEKQMHEDASNRICR